MGSRAVAALRMGEDAGASGAESRESVNPAAGRTFPTPWGRGPAARLGRRLLGGFLSWATLYCGTRSQLPAVPLEAGRRSPPLHTPGQHRGQRLAGQPWKPKPPRAPHGPACTLTQIYRPPANSPPHRFIVHSRKYTSTHGPHNPHRGKIHMHVDKPDLPTRTSNPGSIFPSCCLCLWTPE